MSSRCLDPDRLQEWLDGELPGAEAASLESHLAACPRCREEVAAYRRVFETLARAPLFEPGPALDEPLFARVLPSRLRHRRRVAALGWGYAALVLAAVAGLAAWAWQPAGRETLAALSADGTRAVVQTGMFLLNAVSGALLAFADGWGRAAALGGRLMPIARALAALFSQPVIVLTLSAAVVASAVLLWWMRPRGAYAAKEVRHVGVLGF